MIDIKTKELFEKIYDTMSGVFVEQVDGATPVISFGDYTKAKIATFGINPSSLEFVDRRGNILQGDQKRLTDLEVLGLALNKHINSREHIEKIWDGCTNYFSKIKNPYWDWFGDLEKVLLELEISYVNGSACHLDLFPLATKKMFSDLSESDRFVCITKFNYLLSEQLENSKIETLIFNGSTVEKNLSIINNFEITCDRKIEYFVQGRKMKSSLYKGSTNFGQKILGWSANLQAFRGTSDEKTKLQRDLINWLQSEIE